MSEEMPDGGEIKAFDHPCMKDGSPGCFSFHVQKVLICHAADVAKLRHGKFKGLLLTMTARHQVFDVIAQVQLHFPYSPVIESPVLAKGLEPLFYFLLEVKHKRVIWSVSIARSLPTRSSHAPSVLFLRR